MVRILANGDIVPDEDPRARQASRRTYSNPPREQGGFQSAGHNDEQQQVQQVNIFQSLNQRLLAFGIPPWSVGDIVVEPIVSVGLLVSLMLFGLPGLIFGGVLFAVSRWSQTGAPDIVSRFFGGGTQQRNRNNGNLRRNGGSGGGSGGSGGGGGGGGGSSGYRLGGH